MTLDQLVTAEIWLAFFGSLACVVVYLPKVSLKRPYGLHAFAWMVVALMLISLGLIRLRWGQEDWFDWARVGVFAASVCVIYWRLALLVGARRADQRSLEGERNG